MVEAYLPEAGLPEAGLPEADLPDADLMDADRSHYPLTTSQKQAVQTLHIQLHPGGPTVVALG